MTCKNRKLSYKPAATNTHPSTGTNASRTLTLTTVSLFTVCLETKLRSIFLGDQSTHMRCNQFEIKIPNSLSGSLPLPPPSPRLETLFPEPLLSLFLSISSEVSDPESLHFMNKAGGSENVTSLEIDCRFGSVQRVKDSRLKINKKSEVGDTIHSKSACRS